MTPQKPYLVRAIYDWIVDNAMTPYILVNTLVEGVDVPNHYINDNRIVLNIDHDAVQNFHLDKEWISFSARFSGKAVEIFVPIESLLGIYAKENNEGMFFTEESEPEPPSPKVTKIGKPKPKLKVIK